MKGFQGSDYGRLLFALGHNTFTIAAADDVACARCGGEDLETIGRFTDDESVLDRTLEFEIHYCWSCRSNSGVDVTRYEKEAWR